MIALYFICLLIVNMAEAASLLHVETIQRETKMKSVWTKKRQFVDAETIILPPKQVAPTHNHPCDVIGYIISGRILYQLENSEPVVLNKGDVFHEPAHAKVLHFDNLSNIQPASFVAFYLKDSVRQNNMTLLNVGK